MYLVLLLLCLPHISWQVSNCVALWQLEGLSQCHLHTTYHNYQNYGCACSTLDTSHPVDGIDRCCEAHTVCYSQLNAAKTCIHADTPNYCAYNWSCSNRAITCAHNSACLQAVCDCDKMLMECLGQFPYPLYVKDCPMSVKKLNPIKGLLELLTRNRTNKHDTQ